MNTDISVNMDGGVGGSWKEVTNKVIADNLIDQVAELLGGKASIIMFLIEAPCMKKL